MDAERLINEGEGCRRGTGNILEIEFIRQVKI